MIDDQINIAVESRETLISQRIAFKAIQVRNLGTTAVWGDYFTYNIYINSEVHFFSTNYYLQTKLNDISNRFPLINNLVQKINLRKRRDTIIIGSVIGLCLVFLLWYWLG